MPLRFKSVFVLTVDPRTSAIQIYVVVERGSLELLKIQPNTLPTSDSNPHNATASDMHAKSSQGRTFALKRIFANREKYDGSIEFKFGSEGGYLATLEPRARIQEESI